MSETVDNKVVQLRFEGKQFEREAGKALDVLEKLKNTLKFSKDSSTAFDDISRAAEKMNRGFDVSNITNGLKEIPALGNIAIGAFRKFGEEIYDVGKKIAKTFITDPPTQGFTKYEQKTEAVQTIMLSTGRTIEEVNEVLKDLNEYTDETSYSFTDMVGTIGKFTSAGAKLEDANESVKGIANWAASAGVSIKRAGPAFYNLAQAMSTGALKMQDWKSIELLNMSTVAFKQTAIDTAIELGKLEKVTEHVGRVNGKTTVQIDGFNNTLKEGWLDKEVLVATLKKYSDTTTDFGLKMFHAAQEAKTFTDAIEAVKDAAASGWMESFEYIFGNFNEATGLWTGLANVLIEVVDASAEARNSMLSMWKSMGGRENLLRGIYYAMENFSTILGVIKKAFKDTFKTTFSVSEHLYLLTRRFKDFARESKPTREFLASIYLITQAVVKVFQLLGKAFIAGVKSLKPLLEPLSFVLSVLFDMAVTIFSVVSALSDFISRSERLKSILKDIAAAFIVFHLIPILMSSVIGKFLLFNTVVGLLAKGIIYLKNNFNAIISRIQTFVKSLSPINNISSAFEQFVAGFNSFKNGIRDALGDWIQSKKDLIQLPQVSKSVTKSFKSLPGVIGNAVSEVYKFVSAFDLRGAADNLKTRIIDSFVSLPGLLSSSVSQFRGLVGGLKITEKITNSVAAFGNAFPRVSSFITTAFDSVRQKLSNLNLSDFTAQILSSAQTGFTDVFDKIRSGFNGVKDSISNFSVDGLFETLRNGFENFKTNIRELPNTVGKSIASIRSKLESFSIADLISNFSVEGLFETLRNGFENFKTNIRDLPKTVGNALASIRSNLESFPVVGNIKSLPSLISNVISSVNTQLSKLNLQDRFSAIKTAGADAFAFISSNARGLVDRINAFVTQLPVGGIIQTIFGKISSAAGSLPNLISNVKAFALEMSPMERLIWIWDNLKAKIETVKVAIQNLVPTIVNFIQNSKGFEIVSKAFTNIAALAKSAGMVIGGVVLVITKGVSAISKTVSSLFNKKFTKLPSTFTKGLGLIGTALEALKGKFSSVFGSFGNIGNFLAPITDKLNFVKDGALSVVQAIGSGISGVFSGQFQNATGSVDGLNGSLIKLDDTATNLSQITRAGGPNGFLQTLIDLGGKAKDGLAKLFNFIKEKSDGFDPMKIAIFILTAAFTKLAISAASAATSLAISLGNIADVTRNVKGMSTLLHTQLSKNIADFLGLRTSISKITTSVTTMMNTVTSTIKAPPQKITDVALALSLLAGSMYLISRIEPQDLMRSGLAMLFMSGVLLALTFAVRKIDQAGGGWQALASVGFMMLGLATGTWVLVQAIHQLEGVKLSEIQDGIIAIGILAGTLTAFSMLMARLTPNLSKGSLGLLVFAFSIKKVVEALVSVLESDIQMKFTESIGVLLAGMAMLSLVAVAASNLKFGSAVGLFAVIAVIYLLEDVLNKIANSTISIETISQNLEKFGIVLVALAGMLFMLGAFSGAYKHPVIGEANLGKNALKAALGLVAVMGSVFILIKLLEKLDSAEVSDATIQKMAIMLVSLTAVLIALGLSGKYALKAAVGLLLINVVIWNLINTFDILAQFRGEQLSSIAFLMVVLLGFVGGVLALTRLTEKAKTSALFGLVAIILSLTLAIGLLDAIEDPANTLASAGALLLGLIGVSALLFTLSKASESIKFGSLIAMIVGLSTIIGGLALLTIIGDGTELLQAAGALAAVIAALGAAGALMGKFGGLGAAFAFDLMVPGILAISAALLIMSDPAVMEGAKALGLVALAIAGANVLIGDGAGAILSALAFDLMSIGIIAIAGALSVLANSQAMEGAEALGLIIAVLTAASLVLGSFWGVALIGAGVLAVLGLALGVIAGVLYLAAAAFSFFTDTLERFKNTLISFGDISGEQVARIQTNMQGLGQAVGEGLFAAVQTFASNLWTSIVTIFSNIGTNLLSFLKGLLYNVAIGGMNGLVQGVLSVFPRIRAAFAKIPEMAKEGLKSLKSKAVEAANNFKDGIVNTLQNNALVQGVRKAAAYLGGKVDEGFTSEEGIATRSPSRKAIEDIKLFFRGITDTLSDSGLLASVSSWAANVGNVIGTSFRNTVTKYKVSPLDLISGGGGSSGGSGKKDSHDVYHGVKGSEKQGVFSAITDRVGALKDAALSKVDSFMKGDNPVGEAINNLKEYWLNPDKHENPLADLFGGDGADLGGGSGGGGGGGGSGAAGTAKEIKKLFDVMKDGGKVVQKFAENFGIAYQNVANAHPLQIGAEAVQKLAETIYAESVKGMDATELAAKTAEDKLSEMRDAFLSFYENIRGKVSGAIDEFGKFSEKAASFANYSDWNKALDRQKAGLKSWRNELISIAKRTKDFNFVNMLVEWGPEQVKDVRLLNTMTDLELNTLVGKMKETGGSLVDVITNDVMSAAAYATSDLEKMADQAAVTFEQIAEETQDSVTKTAEDGLEKYRVVTRNGEAATTKAQNVIIAGNNKVGESFRKVIDISDQLKSKVIGIYEDTRSKIEAAFSNFDIFEKFEKETSMTGEDLLDNMESRLEGTKDWKEGIATLIARGVDSGLTDKLMEEGTASYEKVQAMLEWSQSEIARANSMFQESLQLVPSIADDLAKQMAAAGLAATEGFISAFGSESTKANVLASAKDIVNTVIDQFNDPNAGMGQAASAAASGFQEGLSDNQGAVDKAFLDVVNNAEIVWAAGSKQIMANVAGQAIDGYIETITSDETKARVTEAFGSFLGGGAAAATEEELEIQSPSKVFARIGEYCVLGLTNGIYGSSRLVEDATESMGNSAIDSMRAVVGHIADIVNGEVQIDPTIRPVLDLSNVEAGASAMDAMFGGRSYAMTRGINVQSPNAAMNDLMGQMMAQQGAMSTINGGSPINMYVYAAPGQSEEEIANIVEQKIMFRINRNGGVWR